MLIGMLLLGLWVSCAAGLLIGAMLASRGGRPSAVRVDEPPTTTAPAPPLRGFWARLAERAVAEDN